MMQFTRPHRPSTRYQSPPAPPSRRLPGVASGQNHTTDTDLVNRAGYTLAVPHFGPQNGVHLRLPPVVVGLPHLDRSPSWPQVIHPAPFFSRCAPEKKCSSRGKSFHSRNQTQIEYRRILAHLAGAKWIVYMILVKCVLSRGE